MHAEVTSDKPGKCPKCGMTLIEEQIKSHEMTRGMHAEQNVQESAWKNYHIAFALFALVFIAFDMEMIFMYPWAVTFRGIGLEAFLDMFVFIAILSLGLIYMWMMRGFTWGK